MSEKELSNDTPRGLTAEIICAHLFRLLRKGHEVRFTPDIGSAFVQVGAFANPYRIHDLLAFDIGTIGRLTSLVRNVENQVQKMAEIDNAREEADKKPPWYCEIEEAKDEQN